MRRRSERRADLEASTTDPDATPMDTAGGVRLGYKTHYVVDGGKARVIVAVLVTPAEVRDNQPAADLLWYARFRWGLRPRQVTGDKLYATFELIAALEDAGIRAYVPLPDWDRRPGFYGPSRFVYEPERDAYRCPQGHALRRHHVSNRIEAWIYRADRAVCAACPVRRPAPPAGWAAPCRARSGPTTSTGSAPTRGRRPTRRPSASAACGSSRSSARPRTGTACAASGSGASRR